MDVPLSRNSGRETYCPSSITGSHSTVYYGSVLHYTVEYCAVLHIAVRHITLLSFTALAVRDITAKCRATLYSTARHFTSPLAAVPHVTLLSLAVRYPLPLRGRSGGE